jgi:hypothetical protein
VFLTARHHCCESIASYAIEGLIEHALASDWFQRHVEVRVVPFVDWDGVEDGDQGKNRRPRDHGRDYAEPGLYPEPRAIREWLAEWRHGPEWVWLDLHCPWMSGPHNECAYIVGSQDQDNWREQQRFGQFLETAAPSPLNYRASDNLPYGQAWNTGRNFELGLSPVCWAVRQPRLRMAAALEIPYANANGREVTAEAAGAFGRDLAIALLNYLEDAREGVGG